MEAMITRPAIASDIPAMVALSGKKRQAYEKVQPQFWKPAQEANHNQSVWFGELLAAHDHILLVFEEDQHIQGFIIGKLLNAPTVYDPGGLTLMIDDFCVSESSRWVDIGHSLLLDLRKRARDKGAVQELIVCGHHDAPKRAFLKSVGLTIASEWYVAPIERF